jgi:Xaa-Pro aminopeptidase
LEQAERSTLAFETLTLAPIDRALVDRDLMSAEELDWLNAYHADVAACLAPGLAEWPEVVDWLRGAAAPISP